VIGRKPLKESEPCGYQNTFENERIQKSLGSKVNRLKSASLSAAENLCEKASRKIAAYRKSRASLQYVGNQYNQASLR